MEKGAFDPKKTYLSEVLGVEWPFIYPHCPLIFLENVKNQTRNLIRGRQVGVTYEKIGI